MNKLKLFIIRVIGISAGILCLSFTAYALFAKSITSGMNPVKTTGFCVGVTVERINGEVSGNDTAQDDVSGNETAYEEVSGNEAGYGNASENDTTYGDISGNDKTAHEEVSGNDAGYDNKIALSTELTAGTYEITITRQAGGAEGFCLLFLEEGENKITCFTQQIPDRIAFTLILQEETFLTVMPHWGRPDAYGYHESDEADVPQNIYITEGKTVEISSVETGTEH